MPMPAARPRSIRLFSVLLLAAAGLDLLNNLWVLRGTGRLAGENLALVIGAVLPPIIALMFRHAIIHWWSLIAKWLFAGFVAVTTLALAYALVKAGSAALRPGFLVAIVAALMKVVAATLLFRADARAWFVEDVR